MTSWASSLRLVGRTFLTLTAIDCSPQPVTARIDVLPGMSSNVIHPKVKTPLIPVLVYGSNALNVRSIVKSSVRLQNARAADVSTTRSRPFDADHDGKLDRRYYFSPVKTGITCGQTSVTLTGRTRVKGSTSPAQIRSRPCAERMALADWRG